MDILNTLKKVHIVVDAKGKVLAIQINTKDWKAILDYLDRLDPGFSNQFWQLIADRRKQKTISRDQLEQKIKQKRS